MTSMSDEQGRDGDAEQPRWLEAMASKSVCPDTEGGWVYYCDEPDTQGDAHSQAGAR